MEITLNNINPIKQVDYEYPFQELQDILKNFIYQPMDEKLTYAINMFSDKILHEQDVHDDDRKYFKLLIKSEKNILSIKCSNLFTACVINGKYVPYQILRNYDDEFEFTDRSKIYYDEEVGEFLCITNENI